MLDVRRSGGGRWRIGLVRFLVVALVGWAVLLGSATAASAGVGDRCHTEAATEHAVSVAHASVLRSKHPSVGGAAAAARTPSARPVAETDAPPSDTVLHDDGSPRGPPPAIE